MLPEKLAPIVLFVYNRPLHTRKTLEALALNKLASKSLLYIIADGPKVDADRNTLQLIKETREIIWARVWCKEVIIEEKNENIGLADSIVQGVTKIIDRHERIIVLEDDLVTSPGFLTYMNEALELYSGNEKVYHISGYMFPVKGKLPETFFYRQTSCWGWGTWKNKWNDFDSSAARILKNLHSCGIENDINIDGTNQFYNTLSANIEGRIKTWAVLWHFSVFLQQGLSLHPSKSLVQNIGMDASGQNCVKSNDFHVVPVSSVNVRNIPVQDFKKVYPMLKNFYLKKHRVGLFQLGKKLIGSLIPFKAKRYFKSALRTRL